MVVEISEVIVEAPKTHGACHPTGPNSCGGWCGDLSVWRPGKSPSRGVDRQVRANTVWVCLCSGNPLLGRLQGNPRRTQFLWSSDKRHTLLIIETGFGDTQPKCCKLDDPCWNRVFFLFLQHLIDAKTHFVSSSLVACLACYGR